MKSKFFINLLSAFAISGWFCSTSAAVSTLAQRDAMIKEAFAKSPEAAMKDINEAQQDGKMPADDQDYVVIVKKQGNGYVRVAHFKKDKVDKPIEPVLVDVITQAEEKLAGGSSPTDYEFSAGDKKLFAVIEKRDDYLIFNICPSKGEVDGLLKASAKSEVKPASTEISTPAATVEAPIASNSVVPSETLPSSDATEKTTAPATADASKPADADTQRVHQ